MRYELSDCECGVIKPMLPNKPRGIPRVDDRRVLNGIFWVLRSGAPWRDLPEIYGPCTTCYNQFVRWRRAGVWDQIMEALAAAHEAAVQMIDTCVVRVHSSGGLSNSRRVYELEHPGGQLPGTSGRSNLHRCGMYGLMFPCHPGNHPSPGTKRMNETSDFMMMPND